MKKVSEAIGTVAEYNSLLRQYLNFDKTASLGIQTSRRKLLT
jgi:hypothetical protein